MSTGVSIVGTGYMAQKHCAALKTLEGIHLEDICASENSLPVGEQWRKTYGFKQATCSYESILKNHDADIVLICTPDVSHVDLTEAALLAGKHVLCEKPLARTAKEFQRLSAALSKSGKVLQVGMNCRFREQYAIPKDWTDQSKLGELRFARGVYTLNSVEPLRQGQKAWPRQVSPGVNPFLHGGAIHCLDLLRWVGGPIRSIFARSRGFELKGIWDNDTFSLSFEFENGALGELLASAAFFAPTDFHMDLWFRQGSILGKHVYRRDADRVAGTVEEIQVQQKKLDLVLEWEDLLTAIRQRRSPLNSFQEAEENFRVLSAVEESLKKGQAVTPLR